MENSETDNQRSYICVWAFEDGFICMLLKIILRKISAALNLKSGIFELIA